MRKLYSWGLGRLSPQRPAIDHIIARAVAGQLAFEQGQMGKGKRRPAQAGMGRDEGINFMLCAQAAGQARQRDVGNIGAALRWQAERDQRVIDLAVQPGKGVTRRQPRPYCIGTPLFGEPAHTVQRHADCLCADARNRQRDLARDAVIDIADVAGRDVKLVIALPARTGDAAHCACQHGANVARRA